MKIVTCLYDRKEYAGLLKEGGKVCLLGGVSSVNELIDNGGVKEGNIENGRDVDMSLVKILAPIPQPKQDVICLGINYTEHAKESEKFDKDAFGGERPKAIYFSK